MAANSFGLQEEAFRLTPDPRFLFPTRSVVQALSGLLTGIAQRKGLLLVTGESGTGKTAVLQKLAQDLEASNSFVFAWTHAHLGFDDLIQACAEKAGLKLRTTGREARIRAVTEKVTQSLSGAATAVILVDEAEKCSDDAIEGLHELMRIDQGMSWAWQIVLAAAPSFDARLQEPRWQTLEQDIGLRVTLERLRGPEVRAYIAHRLHVAGLARGALFTPEALSRVETYADGVPRLVNRLCSRALAEAAVMGAWSVTADMVDVAAREFSIVQEGLAPAAPVPPIAAPAPPVTAPLPPTAAPIATVPPAAAPAAGAPLLGSMFRQFAEEKHFRTDLSAPEPMQPPKPAQPPTAKAPAEEAKHVEPPPAAPQAAEPPKVEAEARPAEPPSPEPAPLPPAAPEFEPVAEAAPAEPPAPPPPEPEPAAPQVAEAASPPPPAEEHAPTAEDAPPVPAEAPAEETPEREAEPASAEAPPAPVAPEREPAAAQAGPDPEKLALKEAIAKTIAAADSRPTLAAPTEEDRLIPANDRDERPEPRRFAGQLAKIAAAVVIGLGVGALGAYVIQLRPSGPDQIAGVRPTSPEPAQRATADATLPAQSTSTPPPVSEPPPTNGTLNRIAPSAGVQPTPPSAAPTPPTAPPARTATAPIEKPAEVKPEPPKPTEPRASQAAIPPPPPPPPKPPMETPPAPPVASTPPTPAPAPPPPAATPAPPPVVAAVPPPAPPRPPAETPVPAPPIASAAPPPAPPPAAPAPTPMPAPVAEAPAPLQPAPVAEAPAPAPLPPPVASPPGSGALAPILPPPSQRAGEQLSPPTPGRSLAPILPPASTPSVSEEKPVTPPPPTQALLPILPSPPVTTPPPASEPPVTSTPLAPRQPEPPRPVQAPPPVAAPAPQPEPAAPPQVARAEPVPLSPPPAVETPTPARPPAVARVEPTPPPSPQAPTPPPIPLQRPGANLTPAAVERLIVRGDEIMRTGDPAGARLYYELAAANGSAAAATAVGRTWDPIEHARLGIQGSIASAPRASEWYRKAAAAGDRDAEARLRALTAWTQRNPQR